LPNFTASNFKAWLLDFRTFLTRFQLHHFLDRGAPSPLAPTDQGAAVVCFLLKQAFHSAMSKTAPPGRVLTLIVTVLHRRSTSPAETLHQLAYHLGISSAGDMDHLELALTSFTPLPAEPLDQFVWRLQLALDEYIPGRRIIHRACGKTDNAAFSRKSRKCGTNCTAIYV
jgi:hypothetical protein